MTTPAPGKGQNQGGGEHSRSRHTPARNALDAPFFCFTSAAPKSRGRRRVENRASYGSPIA